jgi:hypothetical protein
MRKTKGVLIFLLLIVTILATMNSAMALRGKEVGTENPIDQIVEKGAKGTAFTGNLAIYYYPGTQPGYVNMLIMMRLRQSSTWYPFAGIIENVDYNDTGTQALKMQGFLDGQVVPRLIDWGVIKPGSTGKYRNYSNIVEGGDFTDFPNCCNYNVQYGVSIRFVIMDIEVAIH